MAALNKSQEGKTIARNCWRTRSWNRGEGRSQRCQLSSQNRHGLMSKREAGFLLKGRFHQVRTRPSHSNDGCTLVQCLWQGRLAVLTSRTEKCPCPRILTFLFLASVLEKNADRWDAHRERCATTFRTEFACNRQKLENDLIRLQGSSDAVEYSAAAKGTMP